jgi:FkbM family methyltransferase
VGRYNAPERAIEEMPSVRTALLHRVQDTWLEGPARAAYWTWRRACGLTPEESRNLEYDRQTSQIIRRVMRPDSNSVDAGAHEGAFLRELMRAAPGGRHFAFEPIPYLAKRLRERFPGSVVFEAALGDIDGEATLRFMPNEPGLSSLHRRPEAEAGEDVVDLTVSVRRLDSVLPRDIHIHFMKVDVEAAELELFKGAVNTLARSNPVIVFETSNLAAAAERLVRARLEVSLLQDYLDGHPRSPEEVAALAAEQGHWYFVAAPRDD